MKALLLILASFSIFSLFGQQEFRVLGELPEASKENSGMVFLDGKLLFHNDSGNQADLQLVDTTNLTLEKTISVANATNVDWEDMGRDDTYLYIADIGNFNGDRQDLVIYRIALSALAGNGPVNAETISFAYADQQDFTTTEGSDWDAEALAVLDDRLLVFTKQWQGKQVKAYSIPKLPGTYQAQLIDSYDSQGLVTGAAFEPGTELLYLCGYTEFLSPFLIRVEGAVNGTIFGGSVTRTSLDLSFEQVEAIAPAGGGTWFFSSEAFNNANPPIQRTQRLFAFETGTGTNPDPDPDPDPDPEPPVPSLIPDLVVYRDGNVLEYQLRETTEVKTRAIFNAAGQLLLIENGPADVADELNLPSLPSGIYYFAVEQSGKLLSRAFAIP